MRLQASVKHWITKDDIADKLVTEATNISKKLGHKLEGWIWINDYKTICAACPCGDSVFINPRSFLQSPVKGTAVTFHCKLK